MAAAALLQRELVRRLNGQCRIDVQTGRGLSLLGDRQDGYSCAECPSPCTSHVSGSLAIEGCFTLTTSGAEVTLRWPCPGCGTTVNEPTTMLTAHADAAQVQADPLCHRCRRAS